MKTPDWFENITVLGALSDRDLSKSLRSLGEDAIADEIDFALASTPPGPSHRFSSEGRQVRDRHPWSHTAHIVGYLPLVGQSSKLAEIQPTEEIEADRLLLGQRIDLSLDGFQPLGYPSEEEDLDGKFHRLLFHFAARHFPGEVEPLHFNVSRRVETGQPFRYLNQPLFVGLTVEERGLDLRYLTLPLKEPATVGFFESLASDVARRGMVLSSKPQPVASLASDMAFQITNRLLSQGMSPVEELRLGLGFSADRRAAPLRTGTYIAAQIPSSERLVFEDEGWSDWLFHLPTGQIVDRDHPRQLFPFNYLLLTVDHYAPDPRTFRAPHRLSQTPASALRRPPVAAAPRGNNRPMAPPPESPCEREETSQSGRGVDLTIRVEIDSATTETRLSYWLHSEIDQLSSARIPGPVFKRSPEQFKENLLEKIRGLRYGLFASDEVLTGEEVEIEFENYGRKLYNDFFPPEMRRAYRRFRDKVCRLHIVSEEPWIPWELLKPYDDSDGSLIDDDFLCMRFELTRWLLKEKNPVAEIQLAQLTAVHAGNTSGYEPLVRADDEYEILTNLAAKHSALVDSSLYGYDASLRGLSKLLKTGGVSLLHVIAHGEFKEQAPDDSGVIMTDKRRFRPSHIVGQMATQIRESHPLVFLNACLVGQQAFSLTGLGGWAQAFVGAGCGAFIGPQWSVEDDLAFELARVFYEELEKGKTFGQAARAARLEVRRSEAPSSLLAALAPVVYAHPKGRLAFP